MEIQNKLIEMYKNGLEVWVDKNNLKYKSFNGIPENRDIDFLKTNKSKIMEILNKNNIFLTGLLEDDELPLTEIQSAYLLGREKHFEFGGVASHVYMEAKLPLLEINRAEKVWNNIIQEHEALRSIFTSNNTQKILKKDIYYKIDFNDGINIEDKISETRESLKGKCYKPDIWPLFDIVISQVDDYSLLHLSFDFLILDWASILILLKEFENNYFNEKINLKQSYNLKKIRMNQLTRKQSSKYLSDKKFWEKRIPILSDAPLLPIQGNMIKDRFKRRQLKLSRSEWNNLKENIGKFGFTQTSFLVTVLAIVLNNWSSNPEFTLNLTTMNRQKEYLDMDIINDFTSTELLEFKINKKQCFCDLLKRVQEQIIEDLQHETFTGVEVVRAIRKDIERRDIIFPFVFTSALGIKSSDYKYISLQEEGLSETPQVFMDCQVMEVNQELIINFDLRLGVFSKELSSSIVKNYFDLLYYFSDLESFKKPISSIYIENNISNSEKIFNNKKLKQNCYNKIVNNNFNKIKSEVIRYSEKIQRKNIFDTKKIKDILEERDLFSNQVMLKTLIKIKESITSKEIVYKQEVLVVDSYRWIVKKWENHLEKLGFLEEEDNIYVISNKGKELLEQKIDMNLLRYRWEQSIGNPEVIDYIIKSAESIVDIFNGEIEPIAILFPEGSSKIVESIYGNNIFCNYYNDIIKKAIEEILDLELYKNKKIKILELGAGTGNTTKKVLKMLEEKNLDCQYVFTDRALSFLSNAKNKLDNYNNIEYRMIDIDNDFIEQGLKEDEFDIILAVGVLENAKKLKFTISNIEKVLKNNAWIILLEPVIDEPWILMTQLFFMNKSDISDGKKTIYLSSDEWINSINNESSKEKCSKTFTLCSNDKFSVNNIQLFFCEKSNCRKQVREINEQQVKKYIFNEEENNYIFKDICCLARDILHDDRIQVNSDLYEFGADSLLLAQLARRISEILYKNENNKLDFDIIFRQLLSKPNISDLKDIINVKSEIRAQIETSRNIGNIGQLTIYNEGHDLLRVVFHAGFGTMNSMKYVIEHLINENDSSIACITIKNNYLYCNIKNEELIPIISREYAELIFSTGYKNVQLIGYCSGGCLAIETAHHLIKKHIVIKDLVLLDSYPSPKIKLDEKIVELMFLPNYNITPQMVINDINDVELHSVVSEIYKKMDINKNFLLLDYLKDNPQYTILLKALRKLFSLNLDERIKLYVKTIWEVNQEEIGYEFLKTTYQTYIATFNSVNHEPFPYIGSVRYLSAKENFDLVQMDKQSVINYWKRFCLGKFSIFEIPGNHVSCVEDKDNAKCVAKLIINKK